MALPITLLITYSVLLRWSDILILGQVRSMEEVAVYGAAQKTIDLAMVIITSVTGALLPVLSSQWRQSTEATQKIYFSSLRFYVAFGIAAAIGMTILSESISVTLFGEAYQVAALPLQILAWAFFFAVVSGPMGTMLLASGDYLNKVLIPMGIVATGNVVLNLIFAPRWGYLGSAVIFLLTAFATFVVRQWASQFFLDRTYPLIPLLFRPVIAGGGMALTLWGLRNTHLLVSVSVGATVFILLLAVLGEFKEEPYHSLISLIISRLPARKQT
jgi:O-antigen/teichoic acid export membrane protein